jgi:hypothetical protein
LITVGVILLILAAIFNTVILWIIGGILVVLGAIFWILGALEAGYPVVQTTRCPKNRSRDTARAMSQENLESSAVTSNTFSSERPACSLFDMAEGDS